MATTNSHDDTHNNANDTIEITIVDLSSHLRCHSTPLSGRTITTRIKINKGSTAFTEVHLHIQYTLQHVNPLVIHALPNVM